MKRFYIKQQFPASLGKSEALLQLTLALETPAEMGPSLLCVSTCPQALGKAPVPGSPDPSGIRVGAHPALPS